METKDHIFKYSDHLPITSESPILNDGECDFVINTGSYNVLFQKWLQMNISPNGDGHIAKYYHHLAVMHQESRKLGILLTISDLVKTVDILTLQEFDPLHLPELQGVLMHLGKRYQTILPEDLNGYDKASEESLTKIGKNDLQLVIYNSNIVKFHPDQSSLKYYTTDNGNNNKPRKINKRNLNILFSVGECRFRFIATHVLFKAMDQLVSYVKEQKEFCIIAGDMNQEEVPDGLESSTTTHPFIGRQDIKYTHLDTKGAQVIYDHIWYSVSSPIVVD